MTNTNIIAIDGPAGAGKGTLTKKLCEHYGFAGLDTGSLYRAITLCMIEMEHDMNNINIVDTVKYAITMSTITISTEETIHPDMSHELVKESIDSKLAGLPVDVQVKMRKTLTKIVNERKGGIICILL